LDRKSTLTAIAAMMSLGLVLPQSRAAPPAEPAGTDRSTTPGGADEPKSSSQSDRIDELERRIKALEREKPAEEEAIRSIIRGSLGGAGSKINEFVKLGGSLEVAVSQSSEFSGAHKGSIDLATAEVDLEIKANDWVAGNLTLAYEGATSIRFPTTPSFNTGTDRITADKAFVTIGDAQRFPLFARAGMQYLDFGSSTGVHRADVLSVANPLTVEAFEIRAPAVGIGFGLPTPPLKPAEPPITIPAVRPLVVTPAIGSLAGALGYRPPPSRPRPPPSYSPPPEIPDFYGIINVYDANGTDLPDRSLGSAVNGRLGYRTKGHCGRSYSELAPSNVCPWSLDISIDYDRSIFDSRFLQSEYQSFLHRFGTIGGLASTLKATFGPWSFVGEWNGATTAANFVDDAGTMRHIQPSAWQIALGHQFDWNPWVEAIGEQGDFISFGYSQTHDLAGVSQGTGTTVSRVGFAPKRRFMITAGEWVLENTKLTVEYSRDSDYDTGEGGTGRHANQFVSTITYNF
jgi:hypothetical protein